MNLPKTLTVVGIPVTTFLLVAAVTIEALVAVTGADVGPGIVGVGVGALAGIAAVLAVGWWWAGLSDTVRDLLLGYATVGLAFLGLSALSYVNVPGAREYLSVRLNVAIAVVAGVAVALVAWRADNWG